VGLHLCFTAALNFLDNFREGKAGIDIGQVNAKREIETASFYLYILHVVINHLAFLGNM